MLILHTLATFDTEGLASAEHVCNTLSEVFGVEAPTHQVQEALDQLVSNGKIGRPLGTNYVLTRETRTEVEARINAASQLQDRVKGEWEGETGARFPSLDLDRAWSALQAYLAKAFLRHGIQVVALLDPFVELPAEYAASLTTLLAEAVQSRLDSSQREDATEAIRGFVAGVGRQPERARYIAECADGAFNYYSLAVSPEVASRFRDKLSPLVVFCDTNFLFGILDLHVHSHVEVSNQLLRVIAEHKLPFRLRYHESTLRETQATIAYYGAQLRRHRWPQSLSRAAVQSPFVSGIELKYHQQNLQTGIDADSFLRPYLHVDVLLKERGIDVYRPPGNRLTERATLLDEYKTFLKRAHKDKPYEAVDHDVTVLDCVRSLRTHAKSTLEAGAILISCDYTLYRFDWETTRSAGTYSSVVLPNVFWQVLRPFVPANQDFDRSFAETFAIPEFRTIGSGAAQACSKMLGLLAAYKDIPEETAARLLSNDMLIERLRFAGSDDEFQAEVESAIAAENQTLLEERAAMAKQINALKADKERSEEALEKTRQEVATKAAEVRELQEAKEREAGKKLADEEATKLAARKAVEQESEARSRGEQAAQRYALVAALGVSVALIAGFEALVYGVPWHWLRDHTNSFAIQAGIDAGIVLVLLGSFRPKWRKFCWITALVPLLIVLLSLLGGPGSAPPSTQKTP